MLEDYGEAVRPRLARLARIAVPGGARDLIGAIRDMNRRLGIPDRFDFIRAEDVPRLAALAEAEANPLYPVSVVYDRRRFRRVIGRAGGAALTEP